MRTFVISVAAVMVFLGVLLAQQSVEIRQLRSDMKRMDARYHSLNQRLLMLDNPELVRPFNRGVWESDTKKGHRS
jgi:hypothetical protein